MRWSSRSSTGDGTSGATVSAPGKVSTLDISTLYVTGDNFTINGRDQDDNRHHTKAVVSWYKPGLLGGNHELKAGIDHLASSFNDGYRAIGENNQFGYQLRFDNGVPFEISTRNTPAKGRNLGNYVGVYGQDSWTLARRVTLAAKRAGKYGEGWIPGWLSPKEMKVGCDILNKTAEENGRDPKKITIAVEKLATIAKTREEGLNLAMPTLKTSSESYERDIDSMQFALDRHIFGSVDDVRRRVDEFIENGVQHFELKVIYPTMDSLTQQMELWAENILPRYN